MRLIFLICISLISGLTYAQRDTLKCRHIFKGKVMDGENNAPLSGASVLIEKTRVAVTDEKGEFVIRNICQDTFSVEIRYPFYKTVFSRIYFDQHISRTFILHEETCELESVVITGRKKEVSISQPVSELTEKDLDRTRGLSLGESLKALPGVSAVQTGPSVFKPVIQGMHSNRVLILNNGVRQEGQQWGYEHAPEIDPFVASKISVIKGASTVRYGSDAIGGVILVEPRELRKKAGFGGEMNLVGFSNNRQGTASGIIDYSPGKISGLSFRLQGTVKQAGNMRAPDYYLNNTGFRERNFSWAAGYQKRKFGADVFYSQFNTVIGVFEGAHIGNLTDLQRAIQAGRPQTDPGFDYSIDRPYQDISHELFKARSYFILEKLGKLNLDFARQFNYRSEYDLHKPAGADPDAPELQFRITTHTSNLILEHLPIGKLSGSLGISGIRQANTFSGRFLIPNFRSNAGGIFLIERWSAGDLELEGGIRYDFKWMQIFKWENNVLISPEYNFSNLSANFGAGYHINDNWQLKSNLGTAFRPPAVNELFSEGIHHGSASMEIGDRDLSPERSYNLNAAVLFNYSRFYGEVNLYHNHINNFIYLRPVFPPTLTIRGAFPTFQYAQADAAFSGADLSFNDSLSRALIFSTKFSILRAYNITDQEHLVLTPPARWENALQYHFRSSEKIKDPYLLLSQIFVARKEKVPTERDYAPPPPSWFLFNAESGCTFSVGKQSIDFSAGVNNIFNTRYREYMDRFRYFTHAMGRNFVVRVKAVF